MDINAIAEKWTGKLIRSLKYIVDDTDKSKMQQAIQGAIAEATAWRPIEEAPKDGTRILGYSAASGKSFVCRWEERPLKGGHWTVYLDGEDGWMYNLGRDPQWLTVKPVTHWMPLPAPPAAGEGE